MPCIVLRDGRRLHYRDYGDQAGRAVLSLHGTPGSGLKFAGSAEAARRHGLRLICPDRWGYGDSDVPATVSLAGYAQDAAELADALGIASFCALGVSGGGPFAVAVASQLRERVTRLALVCPVGLVASAYGARLPLFHRLSFRVLPRLPGAIRLTFLLYRAVVLTAPGVAIRVAAARACPDDRRIMSRASTRKGLADTFREGLRNGVAGCVIDMKLFEKDWRLELGEAARSRIWLGTRDGNVPLSAGTDLAAAIDAELTLLRDRGHFWIAEDDHDVWVWLGER